MCAGKHSAVACCSICRLHLGFGCGVQGYFEGLGFEIPSHMNPADAYLDIIAGAIQPQSGTTLDIASCWRTRQQQPGHSSSRAPAAERQPRAAAEDGSGLMAGLEPARLLQGCPEQDSAVVAIAASRRASQQGGKPAARVSTRLENCMSSLGTMMRVCSLHCKHTTPCHDRVP
jgi:hypothetical protein